MKNARGVPFGHRRGVRPLGIAVVGSLAVGGLLPLAFGSPAIAATADCAVNVVFEQDITWSFSDEEQVQTNAEIANAVQSFVDAPFPVTAGISSFGFNAPISTAPKLLSQNIATQGGATALKDRVLSYTFQQDESNGTNWEAGLRDALANAKKQGANTILFVTDGVPNSFYDASGQPVHGDGYFSHEAVAAAAAAVADIQAAGITLKPVYVSTSRPGFHGLEDPVDPTPAAQVVTAMQVLQPGWTIDKAIKLEKLAAQLRASALATCDPSVTIQKSHVGVTDVNKNGMNDAGDTIVFEFKGKNNGPVPLYNARVTDPKLAAAGVKLQNDGLIGDIPVGGTYSIKSEPYTITMADTLAGLLTNVARIDADSDAGKVSATDDDQETTRFEIGIDLAKHHRATDVVDKNENGVIDTGDTVVFTFTVKNTGTLNATNVRVTDPELAAAGVKLVNDGLIGNLAAGQTKVIKSLPYTVTQADTNRGVFVNTAAVTGDTPGGKVTDDDKDEVPLGQLPGIDLDKTHKDITDVNGNGLVDAGDTVVYGFTVTNVGTVTLKNVAVTDADLAAAGVTLDGDGKIGTLDPGKSVTIYSAPYTITQQNVDAGSYVNLALATGDSPTGPVTDDDDDEIRPDQRPGITLEKTHKDVVDVNGNGLVDTGDEVTFTFTGQNTGTVTATDVVVTDDTLAGLGVTLQNDGIVGDLAPGQTYTVESNPYALTQEDADRGGFYNVAVVHGETPAGPVDEDDDDEVPTDRVDGITIEKSHEAADITDVNGNKLVDAGDTVIFTFLAYNPGTVTVNDVVITDDKLAAAGVKLENDGVVGTLAPGATATVRSEPYTLTQEDVDAGEFYNVAVVKGTSPLGPVDDDDDDKVPSDRTKNVTIEKTHAEVVDVNKNDLVDAGDTVVFTMTGKNTGTTTITDAVVTDPKLAAAGVKLVNDGIVGTLTPGQEYTVESEPYTLTQEDVDAGIFENVATIEGNTPIGPVKADNDDEVPADQVPGITIEKTHREVVDVNGNGRVDAGDTVIFEMAGENTGTVTATDVVVTDKTLADLGVQLENGGKVGTLAPGETYTVVSLPYTITEADQKAGSFHNVATVTGTTPDGPVTEDDDDTVKVDPPLPRAFTGNAIKDGDNGAGWLIGGGALLVLLVAAGATFVIRKRRIAPATDTESELS